MFDLGVMKVGVLDRFFYKLKKCFHIHVFSFLIREYRYKTK